MQSATQTTLLLAVSTFKYPEEQEVQIFASAHVAQFVNAVQSLVHL